MRTTRWLMHGTQWSNLRSIRQGTLATPSRCVTVTFPNINSTASFKLCSLHFVHVSPTFFVCSFFGPFPRMHLLTINMDSQIHGCPQQMGSLSPTSKKYTPAARYSPTSPSSPQVLPAPKHRHIPDQIVCSKLQVRNPKTLPVVGRAQTEPTTPTLPQSEHSSTS